MGRVENSIQVELAWSPRAGETRRTVLCLPQGATIADAIARSGLALPADWVSAVWGRLRDATHPLCDGDRLALLRPLAVDPKEARRRRERGARQRMK
ncbi:MAG TPA: RnfH family protein [Burkholderiaceae bacterium]|jgi:putative ubiquitin-RnfH superfamily antitoxin RatB of RatAB toxin-antitoxin module|nr:RnfH family protein [Burkholderiaceae bacterium]